MPLNRRLCSAVFFLSATCLAVAQPDLDQRSLPRPTKTIGRIVCDTTGIRPGAAGPAVVWDFSNLQRRPQLPDSISQRYQFMSELPPQVRDSFPQAQIAVSTDTTTSLFARVGTTFRLIGTITPTAQLTVTVDPYDTRPVEIVYGGRHTDTYRATVRPIAGGPTLRRGGEDTLTYDGFGDLRLPDGLYAGVARLYSHSVTLDTATVGISTIVIRRVTDRWTYQVVDSDVHLLEFIDVVTSTSRNGTPIGQPQRTRTISYAPRASATGVDDSDEHALIVHPNPLHGAVLNINGVIGTVQRLTLVDVLGATYDVTDWAMHGSTVTATLPAVSSGVYTILLHRPHDSFNAGTVQIVR